MNTFLFSFKVQAEVVQEARIIDSSLTPEDIIRGLTNGTMFTSIDFDSESLTFKPTITRLVEDVKGNASYPVVARILRSNDPGNRSDYADFQLLDDPDA